MFLCLWDGCGDGNVATLMLVNWLLAVCLFYQETILNVQ